MLINPRKQYYVVTETAKALIIWERLDNEDEAIAKAKRLSRKIKNEVFYIATITGATYDNIYRLSECRNGMDVLLDQ